MNERLLIVEDEETLCESLKRVLIREGYVVDTFNSAEAAMEVFEERFYDLIITDIILPGITGIDLLKRIKERLPDQIVIIMTAYASLETAVEALRTGAYDYVVKPVMHEEIKQIAKNALRQGSLQQENILLRSQIERHYDFTRVIGESAAMLGIMGKVKRLADTGDNVLLLGEIGTGKELIARAIHHSSKRTENPFVPINLSAIPEDQVEPRLFGHLKGSFAGAASSKKGFFEEANGGTVFLREVGSLSPNLQARLLRVIEDRKIRPVGGTQDIGVDVRFISATNRDIGSAVKGGGFREDLFHRISGASLTLPPLRERKEDIRPLAAHFIQKYSIDFCKSVRDLDDEALGVLLGYHWPGNVKELRNVIERAVLIADNGIIRGKHLPHLKEE
ncbi:MAG TPA: sigma-54 dependent transcriptional regulator [Thermodesulfovibrionales bacterium]|nr:sigma-54 dependent transcriptional regulator [Thermodesulfovibrionales bacterium]